MSDKKEGFFAQIKNQIIAGVGIILTTLGGIFIDEVKSFILAKCAKWWMPDEMVYQDELPLGATGKILKRELKEIYKDYYTKR